MLYLFYVIISACYKKKEKKILKTKKSVSILAEHGMLQAKLNISFRWLAGLAKGQGRTGSIHQRGFTMTATANTKATTTKKATTTTDKKVRRTRKKDIPAPVVPAPVPAAPVRTTAEEERRQRIKALENSRKTARAVFAVEIMAIANRFASAQALASAEVDKAIELLGLDMSANDKETISKEMQKIYYKIEAWPMNKAGKKPVTVAAIMSPAGKWAKKEIERNGMLVPVYFVEDGTYYQFVPVALVRLVNAIQKRFYRAAPETTEKKIYQFSAEEFDAIWELASSAADADLKEKLQNALVAAEEKTVKVTVKK